MQPVAVTAARVRTRGIARYLRARGVMETVSLFLKSSMAGLRDGGRLVAVVRLGRIDDHRVGGADGDDIQRIADGGRLTERGLAAKARSRYRLAVRQRGAECGR